MTLTFCNLNEKIVSIADAVLPVDNGSFRYGYGLFETMLVEDGAIRLKQFHWERLFAGLKQLYFEIPALMNPEWLEAEVLRTVKKNNAEKLCRVRLQIFAGGGGLYSTESAHPGFLIECFRLKPDTLKLNENGLVAGIAKGLSKSMDTLANLKSGNGLIYAIAARQAKENKWNDALVCNTSGSIIESAIANIFWIKDHVIYTPPLKDGCVAGVMRRSILEKATVVEKSLTPEELFSAGEVFFSNAIKRIKWVANIEGKKYSNEYIQFLDSIMKT